MYYINPTKQLQPEQRQLLWRGIKAAKPQLAELLTTDANIGALKSAFGASIVFTDVDVDRYVAIGINSGKSND